MNTYILLFLKFGSKKNIKDLYYDGTIFMNAIQYFRKFEDGELRGDKYEGISQIKNYPIGQFEIPSIGFKGNYESLQIRKYYQTVLGNLYSLYCISSHGLDKLENVKIDNRNKRFGSHCLIIKDIVQFFSLIENKLKEIKFPYEHDFVKYYDKNQINRDITIFEKPSEFEYQKEFRFFVNRKSCKYLKISIGSLQHIAQILLTEQVIQTLQLNVLSNKEL